MPRLASRIVATIACTALAAACAPHVPYVLSKEDAARFGTVLRVPVAGHDPMIFGLDDCVAYKAQTAHEDIVGWTVVLASDWGMSSYPKWTTVCRSEHIVYKNGYVVADFCAQAIGAGGGCAGGDGTYRSRTGDAQGWQIKTARGWSPLPKN